MDDFVHVRHPPPHDNADWVQIWVDIVDTYTGRLAVYETDGVYEPSVGDLSRFIWEEGNYRCDCNRALFFARAMGDEDPGELTCGESRYMIRIRSPQTQRVIYTDPEWCGI